jgi:O-antigen ligase
MIKNILNKTKNGISDEFILGLILFTIPISLKLNSVVLIIVSIFFFLKIVTNKNFIYRKYWISILFIILQLFSFFISNDKSEAQKKLLLFSPFLLLPISFFYFKKQISFTIFKSLFIGTLCVLIYSSLRFCFDIFFLGENYNYGRAIQIFLRYVPHHVYLSIFIIISISYLVEDFYVNRKLDLKFTFLPFLYVFLILLTSRMAMILAVFFLPTYIIFRLKNKLKLREIVTIIFCIIIILFLGFNNNFAKDKILFAVYEVFGNNVEKTFNGISQRSQIWMIVYDKMSETPFFGYGIGDVQNVLNDSYSVYGLNNLKDMNAHNQFFQFVLNYGFFGFIIITLCLLKLLIESLKVKNYFGVFNLFIVLCFFMTENIIDRQWGVIIFSFLISYIINSNIILNNNVFFQKNKT